MIDWSPLLRMALLGVLIALGPLLWLWLRHRGAPPATQLRALVALTLFLTFDLVLFGAYTRLSDSGLGCPDWPGCYGSLSPIGARSEIDAAQTALPSGPVTLGKAWIEMVHRYLATAVGFLIMTIAAVSWGLHWRGRSRAVGGAAVASTPGWATLTLGWVIMQGAFGALTVTMKLYPAIVTLHLLGALGLLALLVVQREALAPRPLALSTALRAGAWAVAALVLVQSALGAWVSSNYAVLACSDFPTCQGRWWPPMDFAQGFTLQRGLGQSAGGGYLPFAALTAIHFTHRAMAAVLLLAMSALAWALWREAGRSGRADLSRTAAGLGLLGLWQLGSGLSNVVLGWPLVAALAHSGGAAALAVLMAHLLARAHVRPTRAPSSVAAPQRSPPVQPLQA